MKTHRLARVAEVVREVASETVLFEMRDPRIKGVTVTRTEVSGDLQHAKVFVSIMGSESEQHLCMVALNRSAGFVQSKLSNRLKTRFTPVNQFILDQGVKKSIEISRLIHEALAQSPSAAQTEPANGTAEDGSGEASLP
jgi:ribosome-binding factor A